MVTDEDKKQQFAKKLKHYLELTNTKVREFAAIMDVNPASVTWWCQGRSFPNLDRIEKMAKYFGCKVSDLIGEKNDTLTVTNLTATEYNLLYTYRNSDEVTRATINRLLAYAQKFEELKAGEDDKKP